jgi:hypothetical protein
VAQLLKAVARWAAMAAHANSTMGRSGRDMLKSLALSRKGNNAALPEMPLEI